MFAENRRLERKENILNLLKRGFNHNKIIDLTHWEEKGEFLEGTGSMILDRRKRIAYCCRSPRSSEKVLSEFCSILNYQPILFDAVDKNGDRKSTRLNSSHVRISYAVFCLKKKNKKKKKYKIYIMN